MNMWQQFIAAVAVLVVTTVFHFKRAFETWSGVLLALHAGWRLTLMSLRRWWNLTWAGVARWGRYTARVFSNWHRLTPMRLKGWLGVSWRSLRRWLAFSAAGVRRWYRAMRRVWHALAFVAVALYAAREPGLTARNMRKSRGMSRTTWVAHRGNRAVAPENTEAAIGQAVNAGFSSAEIDVYLVGDEQQPDQQRVMVTHGVRYTAPSWWDLFFPRLEGIPGATQECQGVNLELKSPQFVEACDVSRVHESLAYAQYMPARIPELEDVLRRYGNEIRIFVELKKSTVSASRNTELGLQVGALLLKHVRDPEMRWVASFDLDALLAAKSVDPSIHTMLNYIEVTFAANDVIKLKPFKEGMAKRALRVALDHGLNAVNLDVNHLPVQMHDADGPVSPGEYFRRRGVTLSTFSLARTNESILDRVIAVEPDFHVTDFMPKPGY